MEAIRNQRTIAGEVAVEGIGYWSGRRVHVEFRPAKTYAGIAFVRDDLQGCPRIAASIENRIETPLRTTLRCGDACVEMIEHIMAALAGMQIDNCEIHVDQPEMPGCDGSSFPFVDALCTAGVLPQDAPRPRKAIERVTRLGTDRSWIEARPCCSGKTILQCELDYGDDNPIGHQTLEIVLSPESFCENLATSRTFVLEHEATALQAKGLGLQTSFRDLLVFGPDGPIDNQLRFADECVRHKLLDMVGDLALAGCDLAGRFLAYRGGHRLNAELVRAVLAEDEGQLELKRCA
ncbi:MAG: UDP-3-O-[3-hydroxymyristoyl] N-acetylglucosamine deacetylase [Pirellulales bacterium]|nr:UDP-3-O-[3-hydroxymyristoyl] N-acetylglucosamine deacetylase [Pirellulales bacterium]